MSSKLEDILEKVRENGVRFSLVWRDHLDYNENASKFAADLRQYQLEENRASQWPGTKLDEVAATVRSYELCPGTEAIIKRVSASDEFLSPKYPEDFAVYDAAGNTLYASCAHEQLEWFDGDDF